MDFNCLFDKVINIVIFLLILYLMYYTLFQGRTLEVMEGVPFRLTHNIVDGLGVTGVEGMYYCV